MKKRFLMLVAGASLCCIWAAACGGNEEDGEPSVTISGNEIVYVLSGDDISLDTVVTAVDETGASVPVTVRSDGGFDASVAGSYDVTFSAEKKGARAEKTIVVEVVSPSISLPEVFAVGEELSLSLPTVECSASSVSVALFWRFGTGNWQEIAFTDGTAEAAFTEAGTYEFRCTFDLDGQELEKTLTSEGYSVGVDSAALAAEVGKTYAVPQPVFSDNVDDDYSTYYRAEGDAEWTEGTSFVCPEAGYYSVRYSGTVGGTPFDYEYELYARQPGMDIDLEGADGAHYGMGDAQYEFNGHGAALLEVSDAWSKDGRYSLRQTSGTYWSGFSYNRSVTVGESNVLVCYIYSERTYENVEMCIYPDATNYVSAEPFTVLEGEHKYFIAFDGTFSEIKQIIMHAVNSTFYIDAMDFTLLDVSDILSLESVEIDGSGLDEGDILVLPEPEVRSSVYTKEELENGTLRVFASMDGGEEREILRDGEGRFSFAVAPGNYTFRYVFECEDSFAYLTVSAKLVQFNLTADCPEEAVVGERIEVTNIAGHTPDSTVTVTVRGKNYNRVVEEQDGKYVFYVNESGYYTVLIQAESPDRSGEAEYEFYAREYDMALDFEGVGEHRGYVDSYVASGLSGYVPLSDEWANDGGYSIYIDMVTANAWYGVKNMRIPVPVDSDSVTFVINGSAAFSRSVVLWIETDTGSYYSESFMIQSGVHSYTLRFGASASGVLGGTLPEFGEVRTFALACVDTSSRVDVGKSFYIDSVVFHPYSEFSVEFTRPEIEFGTVYELTPPTAESDYLTEEELSELEFIVEYTTPDGETDVLEPEGGKYFILFEEPGGYRLSLTYRNRYCTRSAVYEYAFGTVDFEPEFPEVFLTGEDIVLEEPELNSEDDISDAEVTVYCAPENSDEFVELPKRLGRFILHENRSGYYVLRYVVEWDGKEVSRDFRIYIRQSGVFMDFEEDGSNGYVGTPYENMTFLPELSEDWSYDGNRSVKVQFYSNAWYGFTYPSGMFTVPAGTDKLSVWVKSDRTFTYTSFIAFTAYDSVTDSYIWYYTDEFRIEAGVNVYEVGLRLYTNLAQSVDFTPAMAGDIGAFTFHTEQVDENSPDFGSTVYFDSIRFLDTEESNFNDFTLLPAYKDQPYTFDYASPSGFVDEYLVVSYRRENSSEWVDIYVSEAYDGVEEIVWTFDFTGRVDIRIVATSGALFASYRGTLVISE